MRVIGLTGSIGMGKSTSARLLRRLGVPVHDADATVHRLMAPGGAAVAAVRAAFAGVAGLVRPDGGIDRQVLGRVVFADRAALRRLEAILHRLVRADQGRFLRRMAARRRALVMLDIPLLFEGDGWRRVDAAISISAPRAIQRRRVLARPGMTAERLAAAEALQLPDTKKRRLADAVVRNRGGHGELLLGLRAALRRLDNAPRIVWPPKRGARPNRALPPLWLRRKP